MTRTEYRADVLRYNGVGAALRAIVSDVEHGIDRITHQAPAAQAAASTTTEEHMNIATLEADLGQRVAAAEAAVRAEFGKLAADLPGFAAGAAQFAGTPLGKLAITAAEHLAAGILPPEALAVVESGAADLYAKILGLYNPQGAPQPPTPAPAQ